ncbi:MAG: cbb3-type cytochrome oxidase assembly protein CcoS [Candidatus Competibacter sp.]|nr:cbb3-type cytochrome oxidase assembly protein CcoS [Candidatus Competibacter sp.]MDG4582667.1 cbb3-type cytochrome oxidase assembly protein CcoS [Candidatus Competibacter sp.]
MRILYLLIPMALGVIGVALWAFLWAVRTGQFDDLEGPAHRILMDDDDPRIPRRAWRQDDNKSLNDREN